MTLLGTKGLVAGLVLIAALHGVASEAQHWAYKTLQRPVTPVVRNGAWAQSPVDTFVLAQLEAHQLVPSPEADSRTLLRRVYFDLIGLPPTPGEVQAFLADKSPEAYVRVVERLLAEPRYGERWARHWMDIAHFAETHGHDQDRIRTNAWPYRDFLVDAFNEDKPFARFVQEQVAGDILFPDQPTAVVALGFLASGPWDESSLRDIREDTVDRQIGRNLDRDDVVTTVMQTFTSTTVQCARCHDHKFDPIRQTDYYALQAVFAGIDRANRTYDLDATVHRRRQELSGLLQRINHADQTTLDTLLPPPELSTWEEASRKTIARWTLLPLQSFVSAVGSTLQRKEDGSILATGTVPESDTYTFTAAPTSTIHAIRLEALTDDTLPQQGPGRAVNGNLHLTEFEVWAFPTNAITGTKLELDQPSADFDQDGWTIQHAADGNDKTAWGIHPREGQPHRAVFPLRRPFQPGNGTRCVVILKQLHGRSHLLGRVRLMVNDTTPGSAAGLLPSEIETSLQMEPAARTKEQRLLLSRFVLRQRLTQALAQLPPPSYVYAAAADFEPDGSHKPAGAPRPVHVLRRGDIDKPGELATPGALTCAVGLSSQLNVSNPNDEGSRRAALAKWLTAPGNAMAWRSIVNRVWQYHFGRGLVDTPNDFGRMGSAPTHPELLDWLATWFRDDAHGSIKRLHRLILTSAVYRQSALGPSMPEALSAGITPTAGDADNRWLGRMNRTRLDAEQLRDAVLQIAGQLDLRMGGPSDRHFDLRPGPHVTPIVDYAQFDSKPGGQRRGVYRFLFRTLPDPFMDALDCPAGDQLTPTRQASVTVQQALAMWNNLFIARQSEHFAARLEHDATNVSSRVRLGFELALGRPPTANELTEFSAFVEQHGLPNFCRLLFNSNEFVFLN